jgi:DNA-directed RNA polymerase specialized sigma24 family protein
VLGETHECCVDSEEELLGLLSKCSEDERLVVIGHFFHGFTFQDLADELGVGRGSVNKMKKRAMHKMKGTWHSLLCRELRGVLTSTD